MMSFSQRSICFAGLVATLALMVGCASPGPPRPPSLHLPNRVTNLHAERRGNTVVLRFETPLRTTDNDPLKTPVTATLCRAVADGRCQPASNYSAKTPITGSVEWVDALPLELTVGDARRIAYRVETFNPNGHSAGPSDPAFAAGGEAPHKVAELRAENSRGGVVLRWTADAQPEGEALVKRKALNVASPSKRTAEPGTKTLVAPKSRGKRKNRNERPKPSPLGAEPGEDQGSVWLHAAAGSTVHDSGGIIDATASADEPYRYTAVRSREVTLDGRKLEMRSEISDPVLLTPRDTYPPAVPQGLLAAGFPVQGADGIAVDLVWRPNTESDLAGYNVYRQAFAGDGSTEGRPVKLNEKLLPLPAFHDATATRGVGYRYTVTAVDAKGNESAASEPAELTTTR